MALLRDEITLTVMHAQLTHCTHLDSLSLRRRDCSDAVIILLMELNCLNVIKNGEEVCLDGVGVRRLAQDLKKCRVRHEEEPWEHHSFFL